MVAERILQERRRAYQTWPKVGIHRHLPGAIPFETWWRIVRAKRVALPSEDPEALRRMVTISGKADLKTFLKCFDVIDLVYVDAGTIEELTYGAIAEAEREGVIYLELRYSPTRMAEQAGISTAEALDATISGKQRAVADHDIEVSLIAGLSREMGVARCAREAEVIAGYAGRGIDGIDLLGNEIDYPAAWFAPIFRTIAREGRLGITVHAGESSPASSVKDAILQLGATRIGHGVRSEEDPAVLDLLRERGVTLEMCPTSNVQTQATPEYGTHPLPRYLRSGLKVTINTDDPSVSQIDLAHEYAVATTIMGLGEAELLRTLHHAVDAAFTSAETKARLRAELATFAASRPGGTGA
jgi:adenosine deaminase